jgi:hypothetical protein
LQRGIGVNQIGRSGRVPRPNVRLPPTQRGELATSLGKHFRRGIDACHFGAREGIGKDTSEVAGAATDVANCRVIKLGNARDEIEARAKADVSVAKVSLRLPSGHRGHEKS